MSGENREYLNSLRASKGVKQAKNWAWTWCNQLSFQLLFGFQEQLLKSFQAEQAARHSQFKWHRAPPKAQTRDAGIQCKENNPVTPRPTADASTQSNVENAVTRSRTSDMGIQTDFVDVMPDLKEQIRHLSQIVAELTALKPKPQENVNEGSCGSLLTELLSDSLTDITAICPDSSENCSTASANPLPGLQSPTAVITPPVLLSEPPCSNSSPVPFPSRAPLTLIQQNSQLNSLSHGPTDNQRRKVSSIVFMGSEMSTTALACIDALFSEAELANGNTGGSFGYQKLDEHKLSYLSSALRQKFDSPSFEIQWENVKAKINSKCRGKRRTLVKRLKKQANN